MIIIIVVVVVVRAAVTPHIHTNVIQSAEYWELSSAA